MIRKVTQFFLLLCVAIGATYFSSPLVASIFFVVTLVKYFRSEDELFWLAFFLAVSDGFMGFFGNYEATITVIPGLPPVEVGQFYIMISVYKAWTKKDAIPPFYEWLLKILGIYLLFLIVQGYTLGLSGALNVQLRIVKSIMPLFLFYSIPRLLDTERKYHELFSYLFPLAFFALFTQVFTLTFGITPSQFVGAREDLGFSMETIKKFTYRGIFGTATLVITLFGALFYLVKRSTTFHPLLLTGVIFANFLSVFLSATRGWVLGFGVSIALVLVFALNINLKQLRTLILSGALILGASLYFPSIHNQMEKAAERMLTLEALVKGDLSLGGTLKRTEERGPTVMKKWADSPLTGWGFSNVFYDYSDGHVGNQNILLHAGVIGYLLMIAFFLYFLGKLFLVSLDLSRGSPLKNALKVFALFFVGWFIIHSSSGQHFKFYIDPAFGMIQGIFFGFGALLYNKTKEDVA